MHWAISVRDAEGEAVAADELPTVSYRKNSGSQAGTTTVALVSDVYECSVTLSGLAADDCIGVQEVVVRDGLTFKHNWTTVVEPSATAAEIRAEVDSNSAQLAAIIADTAVIGAAGAGLTSVPWNAAWDAQVQSECADALVAIGLDHLCAVACVGADVADNSAVAKLVSSSSTADFDTYDHQTDSLQAVRDSQALEVTSAAIEADTQNVQGRLPVALVGGRMDSDVAAIQSDVITASAIASDAIGSLELSSAAVLEIATSLGSTLPVNVLDGIPSEIVEGNAYTVAVGRGIRISFYDSDGKRQTHFGTKTGSDSDFTWDLRFAPSPVVSGVAATLEITGDENQWDDTDVNSPYLLVEMTGAQTALLNVANGSNVQEYSWQLGLKWSGLLRYTLQGVLNVRAEISGA